MQVHDKPCCTPLGTRIAAATVAIVAAVAALGAPAALACPAPASSGGMLASSFEYAPQVPAPAPAPALAPAPAPAAAAAAVPAPAPAATTEPRTPPYVVALNADPRRISVGISVGSTNLLRDDLHRIYGGRLEIDPGKACLVALAGGAILLVDQDLYDQISSGPRDPWRDRLGDVITDLGSGEATLGISGLVALGDPETGYLAANAVIYSGLSCAVLKAALGRARPGLGEGPYAFSGPCIRDGYNSMPSGHTAAAFALATVLARQYPRYRVFFYAGATLVAISRVYERAHWPSDTLVGAAIGVWSANQVLTRSRLFEITW